LLKRLDGRLRLILPQISAAHEVIRGGAVVIEAEGLPALLNNFGIIVCQKIGVGQVQMRVGAFWRKFHHLRISGDGVGGVSLFQITLADRSQVSEAVTSRAGNGR